MYGYCARVGNRLVFDPIIYTVADRITSKPELLVGKRAWVYPPTGAMSKLDPFLPQQWQWGQFLKQVMNTKSTRETEMVVVVPSSISTTDPSLVYALDKRLITMGLRKWAKKVVLAENVEQGSFNHDGKSVMERIDQNLHFSHLSTYASYIDIEVVRMLSQYSTGEHHAVSFPEQKLRAGGGSKSCAFGCARTCSFI